MLNWTREIINEKNNSLIDKVKRKLSGGYYFESNEKVDIEFHHVRASF